MELEEKIQRAVNKVMTKFEGGLEIKKLDSVESIEAEIKMLQSKLEFYKELEKTKTPVEEAYKKWWGEYPGTEIWTTLDEVRWVGFQAGYNASEEAKVAQKPEPSMTNCVITGNPPNGYSHWCDWYNEQGSKGILHNLRISAVDSQPTPQEPEQVADGLKEAFREAVKQGVVSSVEKKPQTLYDVIADWWDEVFTEQSSINDLVDKVSNWLPKEHDTNSYKWNECIKMIKGKLR